jgi:putative hydrolase of the HAD superfamily
LTIQQRTLIFDADDTLWENNVYFIEATEAFLDVLESRHLDREESRALLTENEKYFVKQNGYGTASFTACLVHTACSLVPDITDEEVMDIESLGNAIIEHDPMKLMPGVLEALQHLANQNRLFLLTKGEDGEQRAKLERSALTHFFEHVEVVPEKNVETYLRLIDVLSLDKDYTWMIGNSPRSDINPALAAGLNAILIPHPQTWEMEIEEIESPESDRLKIVESFSDLMSLFTQDTATRTHAAE